MKPEAILTAATELIRQIEESPTPASELINAYTRSRRYIGSKDRRLLTETVWSYIRHRRRIRALAPTASVAEGIRMIREGLAETVSGASLAVNGEMPDWMIPLIPDAESEIPALLQPAPTVLRANGDRNQIRQALLREGIETELTRLSPWGLILKKRFNLAATAAYRKGLIEIQDEGSQLAALTTEIKPGDTVLDYCAGAGGKSLILAQMMHNQGQIVAHDISERSLKELKKRADRAGATCIRIGTPRPQEKFDHVVVDAPCSGTGTWRRCPDRRWKVTPEEVASLVRKQADIFGRALAFVRKGGYISYMTCSILKSENGDQVTAFLKRWPTLRLQRQWQMSPAGTGTDGLFVAVFRQE